MTGFRLFHVSMSGHEWWPNNDTTVSIVPSALLQDSIRKLPNCRYKLTRNGGLRVKNVKKEAAGLYQCVLYEEHGHITKNIQLSVSDIPDHLLMDVGKIAAWIVSVVDL